MDSAGRVQVCIIIIIILLLFLVLILKYCVLRARISIDTKIRSVKIKDNRQYIFIREFIFIQLNMYYFVLLFYYYFVLLFFAYYF